MEIIQTSSRAEWLSARAKDLTSTEIGALFGVSPYLTAFELWHRKKAASVVEIDQTERMKWGSRLETAIAEGIAEDHGFKIRPMKEYIRIPELRIGSSFDFAVGDEGILEIKNVDKFQFEESWEEKTSDYEMPLHIEIQVQHQLAVSGRKFAYVGALVGGNRVALVRRNPNPTVINGIKKKAALFWQSVDSGSAPSPDFKRDSEFIASLYGHAEPGKILDASANKELAELCSNYRSMSDHIKHLDQKKDELKARILMLIGDAEKTLGDGFSISAGIIGPAQISYERKPYRAFKLNWKGRKNESV